LRRKKNKRYTLEDHQIDHPGDRFLEYLHIVKEANVPWAGENSVGIGYGNDSGLPSGPPFGHHPR